MNRIKRHSIKLYLALALAGVTVLYLWPSLVAAMPLTAKQQLERAWRLAADVGSYAYRTDATQTSFPTPRLDNAGRSPQVERIWAEGMVDRPHNAMTMKLSLGTGQKPIEMKVENGQAFGRTNPDDAWTEVDNPTDIFAPNGDPLGFLVAAENIREVGSKEYGVGGTAEPQPPYSLLPTSYSRYAFDINGPEYADYMRQQLEAALRARGELPAGLSLRTADQYAEMQATGEIWLNEAGLPVRLAVHMEFPTERNAHNRIEADITTTFSRWDTASLEHQLFWAIPRLVDDPTLLVKDPLSLLPTPYSLLPASPEYLQQFGLLLGLSLLMLALVIMTLTHGRSPKFYAAVAAAVIMLMLVTPLLQSNQTYAATERLHTRQAEQVQQQTNRQATDQLQTDLRSSDFNPNVNPLTTSNAPFTIDNSQFTIHHSALASCLTPTPGDTDCDGNTDDDGDGLTDEVEVVKLGTDPNSIDTDGDFISDKVEVQGFSLGGKQWYLDPTNPDSNGDGRQDYLECINLVDIDTNGTWPMTQAGSACEDSDGDTTPNVYDFDDDGDGVPDTKDSAPTFTGDLTANAQSELLLNLSNYTPHEIILVDFQLRPTNPDDLWQNNNVLDWPTNDTAGQITRVFTTTFADVSAADDPAPNLSHGDVMLTPMLQIKMAAPISNTLNPAASLPISATFGGNVATAVLTEWLDIDVMDQHGITVNQDEADGSLYAYVPLAQVEDNVGETPVAWGARMVYRPETTDWGQAHEARLMWLVTMLVDTCDTSGLSNPDDTAARAAWCADTSHWIPEQRVVQTYYEDFTLTGLTVTESRGSKTAVIAQTDALSVNYESHLWQLASGLQSTFLQGDLISPGNRFDLDEIKARFDKDTTPYNTGDAALWDIPANKIIVQSSSAADPITALENLATTVPAVLASAYSGAAANDVVTLLFAREDKSRSAALEETDLVSISGSTITVNFNTALLNTRAALNWAPYRYSNGAWHAYDAIDYVLNELETGLNSELTLADLQSMVPGETISDEAVAKDGAVLLAKNYYLTFYRGLAELVQFDNVLVSSDTVDNSSFALAGQKPVAAITADMIDLMATLFEDDRDIPVNNNVVANSTFDATQLRSLLLESAGFGEARLGLLITKTATKLGGAGIEKITKKIFKSVNNYKGTSFTYGKWSKRVGTGLAVAATGLAIGGPLLGMDERAALITAASITVGAELFATAGAIGKLHILAVYKGFQAIPGKVSIHAVKQILAIKEVIRAGAVVGLIVEVAATIGFLAYTLVSGKIPLGTIQANLLVSETIGQLVVAIIMTIISLTAVGALIMAIVGIIDAIVALVCEAVGVDSQSETRRWVCGGFSGAIASGVSYLIYDFYTPYDVSNKERLKLVFDTQAPINNTGTEGYVAGNSIQLTVNISNTATLARPERLLVKTSYLIPGTTKLDRERLLNIGKTSTFDYSINATSLDLHGPLSLNGTTWQGNTSVFTAAREVVLTEGINSIPNGLYLTEAYDLAVIECWGFIGADEQATCREDRELKGSNNTSLSSMFIADVLPNSFSGLPAFFRNAQSQVDADGDGLRKSGSGLIDPDDTTWDTDGDGLSDYWEANTPGYDNQNPDSDGDGLFDYWEAFYQTRPDLQDSDFEGLSDSDEFFHSNARHPYEADSSTWSGGWLFVYDYNGSQPLQTRVSADPLDIDADADSILDNLEQAYGYHPNVPSIVNVLTLDSRPDADVYLPGATINYTATVKTKHPPA